MVKKNHPDPIKLAIQISLEFGVSASCHLIEERNGEKVVVEYKFNLNEYPEVYKNIKNGKIDLNEKELSELENLQKKQNLSDLEKIRMQELELYQFYGPYKDLIPKNFANESCSNAARYDSLELMQKWIESEEVNKDYVDLATFGLVESAACSGDVRKIKYLLECGVDPKYTRRKQ